VCVRECMHVCVWIINCWFFRRGETDMLHYFTTTLYTHEKFYGGKINPLNNIMTLVCHGV
jgi:hypothetical protein